MHIKRLLLLVAIASYALSGSAQGVAFSYLIPKNGYLSAPVSPLSVRGLGIGKIVGIETGATLYNVPGLAMENLPFTYEKPLTGPHFAIMVPAEVFFKIPLKKVQIKFLGGGFAWWNMNTRINEGNMDRAFRAFEGWDVLNTNFVLDDGIGIGWMGGTELEVKASSKFSITFEIQYLKGSAKSALSGSYTGGNIGSPLESKTVDLSDALMTIQGLEISLGVKL